METLPVLSTNFYYDIFQISLGRSPSSPWLGDCQDTGVLPQLRHCCLPSRPVKEQRCMVAPSHATWRCFFCPGNPETGEIVKHHLDRRVGKVRRRPMAAPSLPGTGGTSCLGALESVLLNFCEVS